ncbi:MAG: succinyl-diaminopimelate desuccinylase [Pseudoprimorskyibacter sp.]|nr:succinyl-diaminopimelate desuccinylase [Pseudoprimorskyibacter sp.]
MPIDPVDLTAGLIQCPSVTPEEGGALVLLQDTLEQAGFFCVRVDRGGVSNLFARWGRQGHSRTLGFNGHTDVVPLGNPADWTHAPFGAEIEDGFMYGRGTTDMKSAVAAWVAAAIDFVDQTPPDGALILTITGDEEGDATDGTVALLDWMSTAQERMSACVVGEPTSPDHMGQMIKVGRRGSLTAWFTVVGKQGHSAYPHRAVNPLHALTQLAHGLTSAPLDDGSEHFDPSSLAIVTIDTGNPASNVIPAQAKMTVNIRYNDRHTGADLSQWLRRQAADTDAANGTQTEVKIKISGESFLTPPGALSSLVADAAEAELGVRAELSTTGGTSDARFVKDHCPVVEFGLVGKTMHAVDERVEIAQIHQLKAIYTRIMKAYFA